MVKLATQFFPQFYFGSSYSPKMVQSWRKGGPERWQSLSIQIQTAEREREKEREREERGLPLLSRHSTLRAVLLKFSVDVLFSLIVSRQNPMPQGCQPPSPTYISTSVGPMEGGESGGGRGGERELPSWRVQCLIILLYYNQALCPGCLLTTTECLCVCVCVFGV